MTKKDIGCLCNFQSIYNTKEDKIYFIGIIKKDKKGRIIFIYEQLNPFCKILKFRESDLLSNDWSYSVPYEE